MNAKKHDVPEALLASLLADYKKPEDLIGENGLVKRKRSTNPILPGLATP
jgi:putative transposase